MTTITKERIELFIKSPLENGLTRGEQMELARIALASLEAEPIAWECGENIILFNPDTVEAYAKRAEISPKPLYAAPPALVVPDKLPREYIRGWPLAYSDYAEGWNDCREAMLQSGSFRENKDSSTNNFRKISETSTNSPVTPDGWISCSERMPNDAQWCVVEAADGYYVQCWSEGQGWLGDDISLRNCDVIRWMTIPEPPEQDGE
ncbi:TPA: DUF551 domain-containing protein [Escherichia coli]|nr:hypothetical protein BON68_17835 [Escherichia coli]TFA47817.1 hypothetical protein BON94_27065 [Escherichia coli]HBJ0720908.1 DUF551 domain-containing protein [Escherichia coli]HCP0726625.1 DUF551 domain-containing protein [Escherichia coli]